MRKINYTIISMMVNIKPKRESYRHYLGGTHGPVFGYDTFDWTEADPNYLYMIWLKYLLEHVMDNKWIRSQAI